MRSTYKKLGPYVRELKVKNSDGACAELRGVNINKEFMPSVANVHGTDLSKYKRVKKHQFAFNPMHVGRDEVLPIALHAKDEAIIVSPAYIVFEVRDQEELLSEYLMMWCRRAEFDRNAWFTTDNSVRGGFSWQNFCDMELPIPSIEKQREIVKEYQTVVDRIRLNERLNNKLEEAAQAIYKQWFVDFEFPMTVEYAESIGKLELTGQPYKSSGGEMEYNEVLEQMIPKGWLSCEIQTLIDQGLIEPNQDGNHGEIHPKSTDFVPDGVPFISASDIRDGRLDLSNCKKIPRIVAENLRIGFARTGDILLTHKATMGEVCVVPTVEDYIILTPQVTYYRVVDNAKLSREFLYGLFTSESFQRTLVDDAGQSTRSYLSIKNQRKLRVLFPPIPLIQEFTSLVRPVLESKQLSKASFDALSRLSTILTARMTKAA